MASVANIHDFPTPECLATSLNPDEAKGKHVQRCFSATLLEACSAFTPLRPVHLQSG
ncbi:MAG: hypothetical protein WCJ00_06030 [Methylotenera sp.]